MEEGRGNLANALSLSLPPFYGWFMVHIRDVTGTTVTAFFESRTFISAFDSNISI